MQSSQCVKNTSEDLDSFNITTLQILMLDHAEIDNS